MLLIEAVASCVFARVCRGNQEEEETRSRNYPAVVDGTFNTSRALCVFAKARRGKDKEEGG